MNFFKIAIRNLLRNGLYSAINMAGLTVSIAACILILLWALDEWNYDRFHKRAGDIHLAVWHGMKNGLEEYFDFTVAPLARAAKENIPEVEASCAFGWNWEIGYLEYDNQKYLGAAYTEDYVLADSSFFSVFEMEFVEGDASRAFPDAYSVVITDELAQLIFGNGQAMGKMLKGSNGKDYHISAVVRKPRQNSMLQFTAMFSFEQSLRNENWRQWAARCFLKLRPGADADKVGALLTEVHLNNASGLSTPFPYIIQPIAKHHLYAADGSDKAIKNIRLFVLIAIALLGIACVNYVNLITARLHKRRKEISMRKITGAKKSQLFMQMMNESLLLIFFSLLAAQLVLLLVMPYFCTVTGKQIAFNPLSAQFLLLYLLVFVLIAILAGLYPAIMLSSFKPWEIFISKTKERKGQLSFRRLLVISQYACSAALIVATIVIRSQQRFMSDKVMGYNRENIFTCGMPLNKPFQSFEAFRHELLQQPEIAGVTSSEANIINVGGQSNLQWNGKPDDLTVRSAIVGIDRDFMQTLGVALVDGNGFTGTPADSLSYFLNETAVKQMGLTDPLHTTVSVSAGWLPEGRIAGVVKDFHFRHMTEPIGPMLLYLSATGWTVYIKSAAGKTREAVAVSERIWKNYYPDYPFNYTFMNETFATMYASDIRTGSLFNAFALIAILVSCLGLFGLVTFTAESKTREIGIRKVLGASAGDIVSMLSKEFLILVGIAMLIAFPLARYWLDRMLQNYAYRIDISWWMFALAGFITVLLTLITVGWQAIKAATANPAKSIMND